MKPSTEAMAVLMAAIEDNLEEIAQSLEDGNDIDGPSVKVVKGGIQADIETATGVYRTTFSLTPRITATKRIANTDGEPI